MGYAEIYKQMLLFDKQKDISKKVELEIQVVSTCIVHRLFILGKHQNINFWWYFKTQANYLWIDYGSFL
jgi:hypothetical protein